jgi:hypothetical protein
MGLRWRWSGDGVWRRWSLFKGWSLGGVMGFFLFVAWFFGHLILGVGERTGHGNGVCQMATRYSVGFECISILYHLLIKLVITVQTTLP